MNGHCVLLRPIDRVFFGPPRVLPAGEVHSGRSEFPPSPYTVAGMLRTHLLEGAEPALDLDDWSPSERQRRAGLVGTAERLPAGWQMVGPFPAGEIPDGSRRLKPWLPLPAWITHGEDGRLHAPSLLPTNGPGLEVAADDDARLGGDRAWVGAPHVTPSEHAVRWVPASILRQLLTDGQTLDASSDAGDTSWLHGLHGARGSAEPPFVVREKAPGVAIDFKTGTAEDHMLYTLETLRFAPGSGLLVWLDAALTAPLRLASLDRGVGRAGRKAQTAAFEDADGRIHAWNDLLRADHLDTSHEESLFWLYLATPARLDDPYTAIPSALRQQAREGVTVSLLAVVTAEPQVIGGMAMDGGRPRDNALHARAGSGWLVRLQGGSAAARAALLHDFHGRATLGPIEERAFGFGFTFVGRGPRVPSPPRPPTPRASQ
jgi:CRISPR type III-B/RAMP module-associated protein Cmr3